MAYSSKALAENGIEKADLLALISRRTGRNCKVPSVPTFRLKLLFINSAG